MRYPISKKIGGILTLLLLTSFSDVGHSINMLSFLKIYVAELLHTQQFFILLSFFFRGFFFTTNHKSHDYSGRRWAFL